ncbi:MULTISPECIES: sugar ABC transporter substrate-binding protein [unclassified Leifsonia]|uniref:sugar ABC transporter substrate-binding protein n=1 Tax=unclassified Leifsonia TaxID=2663824 RepID=UPI0008A7C6C5|nr:MULTISPECIES: sugar ABC transporter substrate-binding protein [unclassified Leifsonia]SEH60485.1 D-xylose transport system substrate-binding protein [Leifsonia sp. CL154]SFL18794.1 D-xylose transport system substrate-binding protein [Leifsonia sp. CL147]
MKIATKRAVIASAAILLTAVTLTACSNGSGNSSGGSTSGASTAQIGLLLPDSVTARYEAADKPFFEAKVAELCSGCKVLYANADGDASKQQQQAESMLTQGVKVLVLDPFDGEAAASIVGEAKAKNVPVISYDRLINSPDSNYYISFDNEKVGQLQAQALVDKLKKDGVASGSGILMVNGSPTDNNATLFKKGAHSVIDSSGFKVLAEFDTPGWDPAKAQDWVSGQVSQFKDQIKGVYAANDGTGGGAIAAMKAANLNPLPPVTGQDAELAGIQRILSGDQYMTVYKAIKPEAEKAAELAIDLTKGNKPKGDTTVKTAGGAEIQSFLLTPVAVTADNIESTVVKDEFYGSDSAAKICTAAYKAACDKYGVK